MLKIKSKTQKIIELTSNKNKKTALSFNNELWELFKQACEMNSAVPTNKFEMWMINYIDSAGLLKDDDK